MSKTKKESKDEIVEETNLSLNFLIKFVKPFDGSREKLNAFLNNCNNAFALASSSQEDLLLKYIISQLEGKAEVACSIKEFDKWSSLREFLKNQFGERKHTAHLLTDLQECKQNNAENVNQFALRVETCLSALLTEINNSGYKKEELVGRIAGMEDLALHTFLIGLHPRLSNIVRCRNPCNLNEAINLAVSEEKIQQILYKQNKVTPPKNPFKPSPQSANHSRPPSFCRYCKKLGHTIDRCTLREENNKKYGRTPFSPGQQNFHQNPRFPPRVNHITSEPESPLHHPDETDQETTELDLNE